VRSEIAWRTDENGMMLGLRVHDGHLLKLVASNACLEFVMRGVSNETFTVELSDLGEFIVRELWNGAIVSEFWVWNVRSVPEATWQIPDSAWNALFSNRVRALDARRKEAEKIALAKPEAFLVQLACSYGGDVAAVCGRIRVFEGNNERVK
jgi:hypothetical protein